MYQSARKIAIEDQWHNFDLYLAPSHGACQGIHPSSSICEKYQNRPKGHKIDNLIWLRRAIGFFWREGLSASVCDFFHRDLPDVELFPTQHDIHVMEGVPDEILFIAT